MDIKPPSKLGKNPDEKALLAYASELRRYARTLEEWDARLRRDEATIKQVARVKDFLAQLKSNGFTSTPKPDSKNKVTHPSLPTPECGCPIEAACEGCDCPECIDWRKEFKVTEHMVDEWRAKDIIAHATTVWLERQKEKTPGASTNEVTNFFAQYEEQMKEPFKPNA